MARRGELASLSERTAGLELDEEDEVDVEETGRNAWKTGPTVAALSDNL
eukprot:CAMPEP_0113916146 /NCGR_PEP_ID=MMETSP0780_2-20120614/31820_1 /TAXON_ID=652834 /ORGANISM="Palpitomonas bilix" /LENGTH=48 /DNA_ID=CAMNT_0000915183 /DNA_START=290 /DNA_END=436 /DNA_ORIENTATION=- /assembly_acc=CAM_ASM_000599